MYITELDEFQGLTADMVREWLQAQAPRVKLEDGLWVWNPDATSLDLRGPCLGDDIQTWSLTTSLLVIHAIENKRPQQLLREINPRMRKGVPSGAAIVAHEASGGHWLAKSSQDGGVLRMLSFSTKDATAKLQALDTTQRLPRIDIPFSWFFWPCDANGNKTRWPTDAEGNML